MDIHDFITKVKPHQAADRLQPQADQINKLQGMGYSASQIAGWLASVGVDATADQVLEFLALQGNGTGAQAQRGSVADAIRELTRDPTKRSKISQIREMYDEIEKALNSGITVGKLVEKLNEQGIAVTQSGFGSTWARVRAERAGNDKRAEQ